MLSRVSSVIRERVTQQNGTLAVVEEHTFDDGTLVVVPWFADPTVVDVDEVLVLRGARIEAALRQREAAEQEAMSFALPLTKNEFLDRLTLSERITIRALGQDTTGATAEIAPGVTVPVKGLVEDLLDYLGSAHGIYLADARTQRGLDMLVLLGVLTPERKAEILA